MLTIDPEADAGTWDYLADVESFLERLAPLREMLIGGDLRPLFLAWLACCYDEDAKVPPIPASLTTLNPALKALAEFYEIPDALLRAAAEDSPPAPRVVDKDALVRIWVIHQDKAELQKIVAELLSDDFASARSKVMAEISGLRREVPWPTTNSKATFGELWSAAGR